MSLPKKRGGMQIVPATTLVTRAMVAGLSSAVSSTVWSLVYKPPLPASSSPAVALEALHVRTDVEVLGALLSDLEVDLDETRKAVRVCLVHLHEALAALQSSLLAFDAATRAARARWWTSKRRSPTEEEEALEAVRRDKLRVDHCLERLLGVHSITCVRVPPAPPPSSVGRTSFDGGDAVRRAHEGAGELQQQLPDGAQGV